MRFKHDNTPAEFFDFAEVPQSKGLRWFLKRGARMTHDRGFTSKQAALDWIAALGSRLDWQAGFTFRLRGDDREMSIVDKSGVLAKPLR